MFFSQDRVANEGGGRSASGAGRTANPCLFHGCIQMSSGYHASFNVVFRSGAWETPSAGVEASYGLERVFSTYSIRMYRA